MYAARKKSKTAKTKKASSKGALGIWRMTSKSAFCLIDASYISQVAADWLMLHGLQFFTPQLGIDIPRKDLIVTKKIYIASILFIGLIISLIQHPCHSKEEGTEFKSQNSAIMERNRSGKEKRRIERKARSSNQSKIDMESVSFSLSSDNNEIYSEGFISRLIAPINDKENLLKENSDDQLNLRQLEISESRGVSLEGESKIEGNASLTGLVNHTKNNFTVNHQEKVASLVLINQDFQDEMFQNSFSDKSGLYYGQ